MEIVIKEVENSLSSIQMTCSVGVVQFPWDGHDTFEILRELEGALNKAKRKGRNQVYMKSEKMVLKSNYYSPIQLERLQKLAKKSNKSEADILRESLDLFLKQNEGN